MTLADTTQLPSAEEMHAINTAGDILRSIATTSYAPLLELDTVTAALEPPPIEVGPFPTHLTEELKWYEGLPSKALWEAVKTEFIQLNSRAERQLATNVLLHAYAQQLQRKLVHKEKGRKKTTLQKVAGFKNGLIFTSDEVRAVVARDTQERELQQVELERKRELKELKEDAKKWRMMAEEARKEEHARLVAEWKALPVNERPTRRQPPKPPIAPLPDRFKDVLMAKKGRSQQRKKKQARDDSDSYTEDSDE
jgi:hypothetical protein